MRDIRTTGKRTITPQKAVKILEENGTLVNYTEAELILDFMYKFAKLSVKQIIRRDSCEIYPDVRTPRRLFK